MALDPGRGSPAPDELLSPALDRELRDPAAARRRRLLARGLAGMVAVACVVAGAVAALGSREGSREGGREGGSPLPPAPAAVVPVPSPPAGVTLPRVPANLQTGRLGGEWRTPVLTRRDVADRLRADGVTGAAAFVRTLPAAPFRIRLSVYAGRVAALVDHDVLDAAFLVRGDRSQVELRDMRSGRRASYAVRREGDTLRFSWRDSGPGRWHGYPPEVQRALYTTAAFTPLGRRR